MAQKERAAARRGNPDKFPRAGGTQNGSHITKAIIQRYDQLCLASAILTHDLADLAAETGSGGLTYITLRLDTITTELHALAQRLPDALELAVA